jgi:hypothetical protein
MTSRVVLLGAGASVDAGVPASTEMTKQIVDKLNTWRNQGNGIAAALNYAVGAMIAHRAAHESNPYDGIDVESLFSAVQMLSAKDDLEIAPFVTWSPVLTDLRGHESSLGSGSEYALKQALEGRGGTSVAAAVKAMVDKGSRADNSGRLYSGVEELMLDALEGLLQVNPDRLSYLLPLIDNGDATIATLNYDLAVETLAESLGKTVDTGIRNWTTGADWVWNSAADVRLLKLHGSIDWVTERAPGAGGIHQEAVTALAPGEKKSHHARPGIVFGARGKLRPEGPFLPMLREFDNLLAHATEVVIVGYSFRDDHINVALSRWVNANPGKVMVVVEPNFKGLAERRAMRYGYAWEIANAAHYFDNVTRNFKRGIDLHVVEEYAASGIWKAINDRSGSRYPTL